MVNEQVLEKVYAYIDSKRDEIIAELSDISSIRSVSDSKSDVKPFGQGCIDVLERMLSKGKEQGFETKNYDNYVGSILLNNGAKENIGLWAHLDVVPEGDGWLSDPYVPVVRDGLLFGRGVGDNKSAAIATFYIQQAIRDLAIPMNHNVELLLGTSEETGMDDVKYYVANYPVPKFSLVPDAGFPGACGEFGRVQYRLVSRKPLSSQFKELHAGTVFNIIPNYAYAVLEDNGKIGIPAFGGPECKVKVTQEGNLIKIETFGLSRHAAGPEGSINAIKVLTEVLLSIQGLCEEDREIISFLDHVNMDSYGTYLGINKIDEVSGQTVSSGTVLRLENGIVSLLNDCRHCVTDSNERIIESITTKSNASNFDVVVTGQSKPYFIDKNSEVIQAITKICQEHFQNDEMEMAIMKGGTYAGCIPNAVATGSFVKNYAEAPAYIQPGHGNAHQPDEYIPIDGYLEGIKLLAKILLSVDAIL
ncbi:MAG: M20 family metallopeptidase [Erysipelotrichaceae bacterium]|nr:M20 family metallopeptidase [Erysipelotrichaceae bacterium]